MQERRTSVVRWHLRSPDSETQALARVRSSSLRDNEIRIDEYTNFRKDYVL